jgi:hypothetical protein
MLDKRKAREGKEVEYLALKTEYEKLYKHYDSNDYDDDLSEEAKETEMERRRALAEAVEKQLNEVSVSPFEIIGCPRIGVDAEATEWFREHIYKDNVARIPEQKALPLPPEKPDPNPFTTARYQNVHFVRFWERPFEEIVKDEHGKWVPELAKIKDGHGKVVGIMSSSVDFRGKIVGRSNLIPRGLADEAYVDHDPKEALKYAKKLDEAIAKVELRKNLSDDEKEELPYLKAAVSWLRFWGERGFGFYAWY